MKMSIGTDFSLMWSDSARTLLPYSAVTTVGTGVSLMCMAVLLYGVRGSTALDLIEDSAEPGGIYIFAASTQSTIHQLNFLSQSS